MFLRVHTVRITGVHRNKMHNILMIEGGNGELPCSNVNYKTKKAEKGFGLLA